MDDPLALDNCMGGANYLDEKPDLRRLKLRRISADMKVTMVNEILSLLSVVLFCLCCSQLIKSIVQPIPVLRMERPYALAAMKLKKFYCVLSWGAMTSVLFAGMLASFIQVYTQI